MQKRSSSDHLGRPVLPRRRSSDEGHVTEERWTSQGTFECDDTTIALRSPTSIDADLLDTPRSRGTGRAAVGRMEGRVMKARSIGIAAVEQRARALAQADFDLYMTDLIDEETLRQRKAEARKKAMDEECVPLVTLDLAFAAFAEAVAARVDARLVYAKAEMAEDAAAAKLVATLQQVEFASVELEKNEGGAPAWAPEGVMVPTTVGVCAAESAWAGSQQRYN